MFFRFGRRYRIKVLWKFCWKRSVQILTGFAVRTASKGYTPLGSAASLPEFPSHSLTQSLDHPPDLAWGRNFDMGEKLKLRKVGEHNSVLCFRGDKSMQYLPCVAVEVDQDTCFGRYDIMFHNCTPGLLSSFHPCHPSSPLAMSRHMSLQTSSGRGCSTFL